MVNELKELDTFLVLIFMLFFSTKTIAKNKV